MQMIKVRIRATGQVLEMVPNVAQRMIAGGTAVAVTESMAVAPAAERAVAPAQAGPVKKQFLSRGGSKKAS
jgi:hypothetical protein